MLAMKLSKSKDKDGLFGYKKQKSVVALEEIQQNTLKKQKTSTVR
ncbi:hypothetical protein [Paenibacillus sp. Soil787]|nr:hypothetical protein [Paenibacillus sp. Soil787]